MLRSLVSVLAIAYPLTAVAEPPRMREQFQLDLGLSVITANLEHVLAPKTSVSLGLGVFSTWFAPLHDSGDAFIGVGAELRLFRFFRVDGSGPYLSPFVRTSRARGEDRETKETSVALGFAAGAMAGWAFRITDRFDVRLGLGGQYIRFVAETAQIKTPYVAIDGVVGYRF